MPLNIAAFKDPLLSAGGKVSMLTQEYVWNQERPVLLIYASCHGRTLMEYFRTRPDIMSSYNIIRLETSVMLPKILDGTDPKLHERQSIKDIFQMADVVITYNMGARHGTLALDVIGKNIRTDAKVITFVAPNVSCFCPFGYGYTSNIPVMDALDKGKSPDQVWAAFEHGDFDPMFPMRWRLELGRLLDKESYHDIGLVGFIIRNHKKVKLWLAPAHPSMIPMAFVGNEIAGRLGLLKESEEKIISMDYMLGAIRGQPETDYEFNYYKFEYPKRHLNDAGGRLYYRQVFDSMVTHWKSGGLLQPAAD
jgi:hypothetical protein